MVKKLSEVLKSIFTAPVVDNPNIEWHGVGYPTVDDLDRQRRDNNEYAIVKANLDLQHSAYQAQVKVTHRMFIVSFLALIISIVTLVITMADNKSVQINIPTSSHVVVQKK